MMGSTTVWRSSSAGFETVEVEQLANEAMEGGVTTMVYHLGDDKPHFNGRMRSTIVRSGDRILNESNSLWEECELDGVPDPATLESQGRFGVYLPCMTTLGDDHQGGAGGGRPLGRDQVRVHL